MRRNYNSLFALYDRRRSRQALIRKITSPQRRVRRRLRPLPFPRYSIIYRLVAKCGGFPAILPQMPFSGLCAGLRAALSAELDPCRRVIACAVLPPHGAIYATVEKTSRQIAA